MYCCTDHDFVITCAYNNVLYFVCIICNKAEPVIYDKKYSCSYCGNNSTECSKIKNRFIYCSNKHQISF